MRLNYQNPSDTITTMALAPFKELVSTHCIAKLIHSLNQLNYESPSFVSKLYTQINLMCLY